MERRLATLATKRYDVAVIRLANHPQRDLIRDLLIEGKTSREIAARITPTIHHTNIAKYRQRIVSKAVSQLKPNTPSSKVITRIAAESGVAHTDRLDEFKEQERQASLAAVSRVVSKFDKWIQDAEASQSVNPVTGEVRHNMDHGALGKHGGNTLRAIELRAKLAGVLQSEGGAQRPMSFAFAIGLPRETVVLQSRQTAPNTPAGPLLDVSPETIEPGDPDE